MADDQSDDGAASNRSTWWFWCSSLLIAVPIAYLLCASIFTITVCVSMATDGYPDAASDYVSIIVVGVFVWGIIIFISTSWLTIPALTLFIAGLRWGVSTWRSARSRKV
jgi:hypothetical protein